MNPPDFERTVTGYVWLDRLAHPFLWVYDRWSEWRCFRFLGKGDAKRGRQLLREAVELHFEERR